MRGRPFVALLALAAAPARAEDALPTHTGESGTMDVPSADTLGKGGAAFSLDLRYVQSSDVGRSFGPSPLVMQFGMGRAEAGLSLRQGGQPGDPRPATTLPAGAGKFSILEAKGKRPALAVDLLLDRINRSPTVHLRAIATTERRWRARVTAFGGGVIASDRPSGWTAGTALSTLGPRKTEFVAELLRQPAGMLVGAGVRWQPLPQLAFGAGASYLPNDGRTLLAGISVAFISPAPVKPTIATEAEKPPEEVKPKTGKRVFTRERPRFPLEVRQRPVPGEPGGPARHYPGNAAAIGGEAPAEPPVEKLLAPESGAAREPSKPPEADGKPKIGEGTEPPDTRAPPAAGSSVVVPPAALFPVAPGSIEPPTPSQAEPEQRDAGVTASDAAPSAPPDAAPAPVERMVPLPPTLKEGSGGEDQVGKAITSFQPALKQCVDRALKRDPALRGEASIDLDVGPNGRVKLAALHSKTLAGGWFEECVRQASDQWRMPRTARGYRVKVPLKIHVANGGSP